MNPEQEPFSAWLEEVSAEEVVIAAADINAEAEGNLWSFSLTAALAADLAPETVESFVRAVVADRGRLLAARAASPMRFYCWHDEQAALLRFSLVSAAHGCLPFRCLVDDTATLDDIVRSFLNSPYHDGIPEPEFEEIGDDEQVAPTFVLPVWAVLIP